MGVNVVMMPLVVVAHPASGRVAHDFVVPGLPGGLNASVLLLVIAIAGSTVAPWQLFFQQSNVVDKRIPPRWLSYERADTVIGSFVVGVGAAPLMRVASLACTGRPRP